MGAKSVVFLVLERRQAMKKRGLKRYYRNLHKSSYIEQIITGLRNGVVEYDYEHIHLDGYSLTKWSEIRLHLDVLFKLLAVFKFNSETIRMPFQVWGYVCFQRDLGCQIGLYIHTPNCDFDDFPMIISNISEIPTTRRKELLAYLESMTTKGYDIRYSNNCDKEPEIFIAIKNVGLPIFIPIKNASDETDR